MEINYTAMAQAMIEDVPALDPNTQSFREHMGALARVIRLLADERGKDMTPALNACETVVSFGFDRRIQASYLGLVREHVGC